MCPRAQRSTAALNPLNPPPMMIIFCLIIYFFVFEDKKISHNIPDIVHIYLSRHTQVSKTLDFGDNNHSFLLFPLVKGVKVYPSSEAHEKT